MGPPVILYIFHNVTPLLLYINRLLIDLFHHEIVGSSLIMASVVVETGEACISQIFFDSSFVF